MLPRECGWGMPVAAYGASARVDPKRLARLPVASAAVNPAELRMWVTNGAGWCGGGGPRNQERAVESVRKKSRSIAATFDWPAAEGCVPSEARSEQDHERPSARGR